MLINSVAMDEYYVVLGIKQKQKGNVICYARQSVNTNQSVRTVPFLSLVAYKLI